MVKVSQKGVLEVQSQQLLSSYDSPALTESWLTAAEVNKYLFEKHLLQAENQLNRSVQNQGR